MISGTVFVDLSEVDSGAAMWQRTDRALLDVLNRAPEGARVLVYVGSRKHVSMDAARWLHEHDHRLMIEIVGTDPEIVADFIHAGRKGQVSL